MFDYEIESYYSDVVTELYIMQKYWFKSIDSNIITIIFEKWKP